MPAPSRNPRCHVRRFEPRSEADGLLPASGDDALVSRLTLKYWNSTSPNVISIDSLDRSSDVRLASNNTRLIERRTAASSWCEGDWQTRTSDVRSDRASTVRRGEH